MKIEAARSELEQYIITLDTRDCAGDLWGRKVAVWQDGSSGDTPYRHALAVQTSGGYGPGGPVVSGFKWEPHPRWHTRIRVSRQLCLPGLPNTFPSAKAYAAAAAWSKKVAQWRERGPEPIRVPPPPDFSTPAKVTARCLEAGSGGLAGLKDQTFGRLYRAFRKVAATAVCSVEDRHRPKWNYVYVPSSYNYRTRETTEAHYRRVKNKPEPVPVVEKPRPRVVSSDPRKHAIPEWNHRPRRNAVSSRRRKEASHA